VCVCVYVRMYVCVCMCMYIVHSIVSLCACVFVSGFRVN
jgi:hypothetical protein